MKKIALVTGGATRIGKQICIYLASRGWKTVIHYNKSERDALELKKHIDGISECMCIQSDFSKYTDFKKFIADIVREIGVPSLLINNASVFTNDNILDLDFENFSQNMSVNCFAPMMLAREFFAVQTGEANIINMLDYTVTHNMHKKFLSYNLSKMCMLYATRHMALKFAPKCRVNAISPAIAMKPTSFTEDEFNRLIQASPIPQTTSTKEICATIDWILSSPTFTGQNVVLDGGSSLI